jgi:CDP-diacylglycerol--glycerol-3-phosphate 3-phosphatidyltransferase
MANVISPDPAARPDAAAPSLGQRRGRINLPNQLTLARLFLTLAFVATLSSESRFAHTAGLLLFVVAGITDYLDGEIARRWNLMTDFGKLMDPLVDKILMAAAFICLIPHGAIAPWVAVVIISREFLITGLRLLAASKGRLLPAEKLGKHKTTWQIITAIYFLLLLAIAELDYLGVSAAKAWWATAWSPGGLILVAVTLILTLYSGLGYLWKNRELITAE